MKLITIDVVYLQYGIRIKTSLITKIALKHEVEPNEQRGNKKQKQQQNKDAYRSPWKRDTNL